MEESRFEIAEEADAGELLCRLRVLGARLDRLKEENAKVGARIENLKSELRGGQEQQKVEEENLKGTEQDIAKSTSATIEMVHQARV